MKKSFFALLIAFAFAVPATANQVCLMVKDPLKTDSVRNHPTHALASMCDFSEPCPSVEGMKGYHACRVSSNDRGFARLVAVNSETMKSLAEFKKLDKICIEGSFTGNSTYLTFHARKAPGARLPKAACTYGFGQPNDMP